MSKQQQPTQLKDIVISEHGSLGLLALGSQGLRIWREKKAEAEAKLSTEKTKPTKKHASKK